MRGGGPAAEGRCGVSETELEQLMRPGGAFYVNWGPWAKPHFTRVSFGWTLTLGRLAFGYFRFDVECFVLQTLGGIRTRSEAKGGGA